MILVKKRSNCEWLQPVITSGYMLAPVISICSGPESLPKKPLYMSPR
jgi:hypothetical protein